MYMCRKSVPDEAILACEITVPLKHQSFLGQNHSNSPPVMQRCCCSCGGCGGGGRDDYRQVLCISQQGNCLRLWLCGCWVCLKRPNPMLLLPLLLLCLLGKVSSHAMPLQVLLLLEQLVAAHWNMVMQMVAGWGRCEPCLQISGWFLITRLRLGYW